MEIKNFIQTCLEANKLKGRLVRDVTLVWLEHTLYRGCESDLLIKLPNGLYHFEVGHYSFQLSTHDFEFI
jgi:hypothetical protein